MTVLYEKIINEIEVLLQLYMNNQRLMTNTTQPANLHSVLEAMTSLRRSRDIVNATNIIHKVKYKHFTLHIVQIYCIQDFFYNINLYSYIKINI